MVGHEITHVLEGTELYSELQSAIVEYAKSKGDYQDRYDTLSELYKDIEGADIDAELTADLVGDYIFTDVDFVKRLSAEHRNIFQKIYDEIKHLCKLATAGSKEARELEKIEKIFEEVYRTETKNPTKDGGVRYSIRLTESDTADYLRSGNRNNKSRQKAFDKGEQIILTSEAEIKEYIDSAINKEQGLNTVAYGRVNSRLSNDVSKNSNGAIEIENAYLELVPGDLQHAYEQHSIAKEEGDIPLTIEDFENIPEYLDNYSELLYAIKYASGRTHICVSKVVDNGRILIIETVSKSRGSIQFKNAIGVTEEKYQNKYLPMYKKGSGVNTRGSQGSNTSLRDTTTSNNSIRNPDEKVKKFSLGIDERKAQQLAIILDSNPMWDDYHTGIRSVEDIRTWEEVLKLDDEREGQFGWGDFSREDAEEALKNNSVMVYSSYPISNGTFVSTSYTQAWEYAGGNKNAKVYSKEVPLDEVAWINGDEGQYAKVEADQDVNYSISADEQATTLLPGNIYGKDVVLEEIAPVVDSNANSTEGVNDIDFPLPDDYKGEQIKQTEAVSREEVETVVGVSARMAKNGQKTTQQSLNPVVQKPSAKNVQDANENTAVLVGTTVPTNTAPQNLDDVKSDEEIIKTVKERLSTKITNSTEELSQIKLLRDWVKASYDHKIAILTWSKWRDSFASAPLVQIEVRLGQALGGGARPHRI